MGQLKVVQGQNRKHGESLFGRAWRWRVHSRIDFYQHFVFLYTVSLLNDTIRSMACFSALLKMLHCHWSTKRHLLVLCCPVVRLLLRGLSARVWSWRETQPRASYSECHVSTAAIRLQCRLLCALLPARMLLSSPAGGAREITSHHTGL